MGRPPTSAEAARLPPDPPHVPLCGDAAPGNTYLPDYAGEVSRRATAAVKGGRTGGVCGQAGTCDILPLQPVPLCCESLTDGTCRQLFLPPGGTVSSTDGLWLF